MFTNVSLRSSSSCEGVQFVTAAAVSRQIGFYNPTQNKY